MPARCSAVAVKRRPVSRFPSTRRRVVWLAETYDRDGAAAMDCLAADSLCWSVTRGKLFLRHDSGRVVAEAALGLDTTQVVTGASVFADSADKSAWVFVDAHDRLIHVDRRGVIHQDLKIGGERVYVRPVAFDAARRSIWFVRRRMRQQAEIMRIDLGDPQLRQQLVATLSENPRWLLPDRAGGAWIVSDQVWRVDNQGRITALGDLGGALRSWRN
jgi:hypothetical protein